MRKILKLIIVMIIYLFFHHLLFGDEIFADIFLNEFFGINASEKYNNIANKLSKESILFKNYNQIIIKKALPNKPLIIYALLNFKNQYLIDSLLVVEEPSQNINEKTDEYINLLKNNYKFKKINNLEFVFWNSLDSIIELFIEPIDDNKSWICFHYYLNNNKINREENLSNIKFYSYNRGTDFSIGFSLMPLSFHQKISSARTDYTEYEKNENTNEYEKTKDRTSTGIGPFDLGSPCAGVGFVYSYSYYYKPYSSVGFTASLSYMFCMPIISAGPSPAIYNYISSRLLLKRKIGEYNKNYRFIFEPGLIINLEIPYYFSQDILIYKDVTSTDVHSKTEVNFPDFLFSAGPVFNIGFEYHKKNYSFEFLAFSAVGIGFVADESLVRVNGPNVNFTIIPIGIELRWNYYKMLAKKK